MAKRKISLHQRNEEAKNFSIQKTHKDVADMYEKLDQAQDILDYRK